MAQRKKLRHFRAKPIPVKLDESLLARVDALAEKLHEPRSTIMRFAMRIGMENLEKAMSAGADLAHLARRTDPHTYPEPEPSHLTLVEERPVQYGPKKSGIPKPVDLPPKK